MAGKISNEEIKLMIENIDKNVGELKADVKGMTGKLDGVCVTVGIHETEIQNLKSQIREKKEEKNNSHANTIALVSLIVAAVASIAAIIQLTL